MYWDWKKSGIALAACFLLAVVLVKPIGVSTQFVIFDGLVASLFNEQLVVSDVDSKSGYASSNTYLNKSGGKYAKAIANPVNYSFVFVISMLVGGFIASMLQKKSSPQLPVFHEKKYASTMGKRYLMTFIGGILVLFGARLAGGCTSGHMMSGMMQTAVSGYVFALAAFLAAVPVAILIYGRGNEQ